jgi:hypothetical protein
MPIAAPGSPTLLESFALSNTGSEFGVHRRLSLGLHRPIVANQSLANCELGAPRCTGYWLPRWRQSENRLGRCRRRSWSSWSPRSLLRCGRGFGYDRLHLLGRTPTTTETKLFGKPRSAFRIAGRGDWMFTRQVPAGTILVDARSMAA